MYMNREYKFGNKLFKVSVHFSEFLGSTYASTKTLEIRSHGESDKPKFSVPDNWAHFQLDNFEDENN